MKEAQQALAELSVEFDRSQQTPAEGRNAALEILAPLESLQAQLSVQQEQGGVLAEVLGCYASCVSAIRGLSEYESKSIVDFSSKIKYTHLQVTYEYAKLVESLSSTS